MFYGLPVGIEEEITGVVEHGECFLYLERLDGRRQEFDFSCSGTGFGGFRFAFCCLGNGSDDQDNTTLPVDVGPHETDEF